MDLTEARNCFSTNAVGGLITPSPVSFESISNMMTSYDGLGSGETVKVGSMSCVRV